MVRRKHLLWLTALLAMLAAGCGGSSGADSSSPKTTAPAETPAGGPVGKGVTADAINIGVTFIDFKALEKFNTKVNRGDEQVAWQALIDDINAHGGVLGRKLKPTYVKYNLIEAASGEAACLKLTEDSENFLVLNGFLFNAKPSNKCLIDHGTGLIGGSDPDPTVATVPWISAKASEARRMSLWANLLVKTGTLQGKKFAVLGNVQDKANIEARLIAPLEKSGHEPEDFYIQDVPEGDLQASNASLDIYLEKMRSDGVEHVILAGEAAASATYLLKRGYKGQISSDYADVVSGLGNSDELPKEAFNGILSMSDLGTKTFGHPANQRCIKIFEKAHPEIGELKDPIQVKTGDADWATSVNGACDNLALLVKVLEAAGTPSHEAVLNAIKTKMRSFSFGTVKYASFGPNKFDAGDAYGIAVFDSTIGKSGGVKLKGELVNVAG